MDAKEIVNIAALALYNKKGLDIIALDVSKLTVIADAMIIASARNVLQLKSLADEVEDKLAEVGVTALRKDNQQGAHWLVLDYGAVLVHLFHTQEREFYRLDKLWEHDQNRMPLPFENEEI